MGDGAVIRELTIVYETATGGAVSIPSGATRFGGIAGTIGTAGKTTAGDAQLINVLVKGAVTMDDSDGNNIYAGGIVGLMQGTSSINNAYGGLDLTVTSDPGASNSLYVGGVAGSMGRPANGDPVTVEEVTVVGNITVGSQGKPIDAYPTANFPYGLFVGGIAGFMRGASGGQAVLKNSDYKDGSITVTSRDGVCTVGGAAGGTFGYITIDKCNSRQSGFNIEKTGSGSFYAGGFVGDFYYSSPGTAGTIENSYSIGPVTVISGPLSTAGTVGGGFAGRIDANISRCYAQGNVHALGYGSVYAGGFAGLFLGSSKAEYCYATGEANAIGRKPSTLPSSANVYAGGFAGYCYTISNCYATGNVFADAACDSNYSQQDYLYAGGLLGSLQTSGGLDHCFSTGSVTAQRSNDRPIYAGGLVGYTRTRKVTCSAALGASVTATGGASFTVGGTTVPARNVGRVFGDAGTAGNSNNHANNAMQLYSDSNYAKGKPQEIDIPPLGTPPADNPLPADTNKHGKDAHDGLFRTSTFWTDLTFSSTYWDLNTGKRHPILKGLGGQ